MQRFSLLKAPIHNIQQLTFNFSLFSFFFKPMATTKIGLLFLTDDSLSNKMAHRMLQSCFYKALCVGKAMDAARALVEVKDTLNIVLTNFHTLEMVGSQFLDHIHKTFHVPIIKLTPDSNRVQWKGDETKAAAYILIDLSLDVIHKIWHDVMTATNTKNHEEQRVVQPDKTDADNGKAVLEDSEEGERREEEEEDDNGRKTRFIWTSEMHQKFLDALDYLGPDRAFPKKIVDTMNVPGLTRANVASHLQKHRINAKKAEEEEENSNMNMYPGYNVTGSSILPYNPLSCGFNSTAAYNPLSCSLSSNSPYNGLSSTAAYNAMSSVLNSSAAYNALSSGVDSTTPYNPLSCNLNSIAPGYPGISSLLTGSPIEPITTPGGLNSTTPGYPSIYSLLTGSPIEPITTPVHFLQQQHNPNLPSPSSSSSNQINPQFPGFPAPPLMQQFQQNMFGNNSFFKGLTSTNEIISENIQHASNPVVSQNYFGVPLIGGSIMDQSSVHLPPMPPISPPQQINGSTLGCSISQPQTSEYARTVSLDHMYESAMHDDLALALLLNDITTSSSPLFGEENNHDHHQHN